MFLYADDSKIFRHILNDDDHKKLQDDLDQVKLWFDKWLVKLNIDKCKTISYGINNINNNKYSIDRNGERVQLESVNKISDLGVMFDNRLKFNHHISSKINKAYSMLGIIKRNFNNLSEDVFINLYKTLIRPHLEYAEAICRVPTGCGKLFSRTFPGLLKDIFHHFTGQILKRSTSQCENWCK